jgi:hypothetical protein
MRTPSPTNSALIPRDVSRVLSDVSLRSPIIVERGRGIGVDRPMMGDAPNLGADVMAFLEDGDDGDGRRMGMVELE